MIFLVLGSLIISLKYVVKNKKIKTMLVIFVLLLSVGRVVKAEEQITINFTVKQNNSVKVNFLDRNWKEIDMGYFTTV